MTLTRAIKLFLATTEGATSADIKEEIITRYPKRWKAAAVQAHIYACAVNNPKVYLHHPTREKFLYRTPEGIFKIYSEHEHGPNTWEPPYGPGDTP